MSAANLAALIRGLNEALMRESRWLITALFTCADVQQEAETHLNITQRLF